VKKRKVRMKRWILKKKIVLIIVPTIVVYLNKAAP